MHPFMVLLGILLGSLFSIAFSLLVVLLVFWILREDNPRFLAEMPELVRATLIFAVLTAIAAGSFLGTIRRRRWRYGCLLLLWTGLLLTALYYWPG